MSQPNRSNLSTGATEASRQEAGPPAKSNSESRVSASAQPLGHEGSYERVERHAVVLGPGHQARVQALGKALNEPAGCAALERAANWGARVRAGGVRRFGLPPEDARGGGTNDSKGRLEASSVVVAPLPGSCAEAFAGERG